MDSNLNFITIRVTFCILSLFKVQASGNEPLNSFLYNYAFNAMHRPRTGRLYEVIPPANMSGVGISIIRLRTHSLWRNGANFSAIELPPTILPSPYTKRVDIVYQNLGNWSTSYYNVPNYTFVTSVVGFLPYDSITHRLVELKARQDNPMIVRFQHVAEEDAGRMCVKFSVDGTLEFSNVGVKSSCEAKRQGLFAIVVPYNQAMRARKMSRVLKWWMVGIPAGIGGLIMVLVVGIVGFKMFEWIRVGKMEKESEKSEVLDAIWVGNSRMPAATGIRTQPVLENSYLP